MKEQSNEQKTFTYRSLLEELQKLTSEQLDQKAIFSGDETGGDIFGVHILDEDYVNPSGDGCEPISVYADDEDFKDLEVVFEKGTVFIVID